MALGNHLFCFGMGYCATALAATLANGQWRISGTTRIRDAEKTDIMTSQLATVHKFDGTAPLADAAGILNSVTHILISIPPTGDGDPVLTHHSEQLAALPDLKWIGYLSTTGVYGDTGGQLVDETATPQPTSARSERRLQAERQWLELHKRTGAPVHIFRLPGIYGPGRSALDQVRAGKFRRIDKPGHMFSRIHVDDIAAALSASMARPNPGRIYNVCDNEAAAPAEVTAYACTLLGVPAPKAIPFDDAAREMSEMALSFWQDNRRVSNERIRTELGLQLKYPTYREGLSAIQALQSES